MTRYNKEQVSRALHENESLPEKVRSYFQAILDDNLPRYYLDDLSAYRFDFSDELPQPDVPDTHPDYKFLRLQFREGNPRMKCRANVILGISLSLQGVIEDEVLTGQNHMGLVEAYRTKEWNAFKGSRREYWTSTEEIEFINSTLDTMIASIKEVHHI